MPPVHRGTYARANPQNSDHCPQKSSGNTTPRSRPPRSGDSCGVPAHKWAPGEIEVPTSEGRRKYFRLAASPSHGARPATFCASHGMRTSSSGDAVSRSRVFFSASLARGLVLRISYTSAQSKHRPITLRDCRRRTNAPRQLTWRINPHHQQRRYAPPQPRGRSHSLTPAAAGAAPAGEPRAEGCRDHRNRPLRRRFRTET